MQKQKRERTADEELFITGHEQRMHTVGSLNARIRRDAKKYILLKNTTSARKPPTKKS